MLKFTKKAFSNLLKNRVAEQIPEVQSQVRGILKNHGKKELATISIENVIMGMKELPLMFYPCSSLDPSEGIRFRGLTISEMKDRLPKVGSEPLPEAVFWLLMTGEIPTLTELEDLQSSIINENEMPQSTFALIKNNAKVHHPMTTLSMALLDLQKESQFYKRYSQGDLKKPEYWDACYKDSIFGLRMLPKICAEIYTTKYNKKSAAVTNSDWAGLYSNLMGFSSLEMAEVLRSYLAIHTDHEGGNISAHSAYIASSALCDPFLSFSNAVNGLAGPLHGLANQEVLKFLLGMSEQIEKEGYDLQNPNSEECRFFIRSYVQNHLKKGVIPGYGHGRLRTTDPRYTHLKTMAQDLIPNKKLVKLIHASEDIITEELTKLGKVKNPNPNVDAHSGVLVYELGLKEFEYYTVIFALSRAVGCFANMTWARAIGLPLERPGSMTLEQLKDAIKN